MPVLDQALLDDVELLVEERGREALAPDVLIARIDKGQSELARLECTVGDNGAFEN